MLGMLYHDLGDLDRALVCHQATLDMSRALGYRQGEAAGLSNLGTVLRSRGELTRALDVQNQALAIIQSLHNPDLEWTLLAGRAATYEAMGDPVRSRADYEMAVQRTETVRIGLAEEVLRLGVLASDRMDVYRCPVLLLHRSFHETWTAFEVVERARARTLLEQLGTTELRTSTGVSSDIVAEEHRLLERLRGLQRALRRERLSLEERSMLAEVTRVVQTELDTLWNQLRGESPDYVALRRGEPTNREEMRALLQPLVVEPD